VTRWILVLAPDGTPLTEPRVYDGKATTMAVTADSRTWDAPGGVLRLRCLTWTVMGSEIIDCPMTLEAPLEKMRGALVEARFTSRPL
jgi:hypothetical protein